MVIAIISSVERSQTDEVTERELVGPEHEEDDVSGPEFEATQGRLKLKEPNPAKKKGLRDEYHIYESLSKNADK